MDNKLMRINGKYYSSPLSLMEHYWSSLKGKCHQSPKMIIVYSRASITNSENLAKIGAVFTWFKDHQILSEEQASDRENGAKMMHLPLETGHVNQRRPVLCLLASSPTPLHWSRGRRPLKCGTGDAISRQIVSLPTSDGASLLWSSWHI